MSTFVLGQRRSPPERPNLPKGWRLVRLGEVIADAQVGFASGSRDPSGIVQLRMNNVTARGSFDWSSFLRVPANPEILEVYRLDQGDVLFNNTNSAELVGKTALFSAHEEPVVYSNHFTRLRTRDDVLTPEFLAFWLQAQWHAGLFAAICNRWIGQAAVQRDKLLSLELAIPALAEQRRIAAMLTEQMAAVERARAAAEARVAGALVLRTAYLDSVFSGILRGSCPVKKLGEIAQVTGGIQKSPDRAPRQFHRPFLTVRNVQRGSLDLSEVQRFEITPDELERLRLQIGDLLIVEGNGSRDHIGRNAIFDIPGEEWIHQNHVIRVRLSREIAHPEFVSLYLNSPQGAAQLLEKARTTSGLYTLSVGKVSSLVVPVPPLEQQISMTTKLQSHVSTADRCRLSAESEIAVIVALPAALLRRAFQGS